MDERTTNKKSRMEREGHNMESSNEDRIISLLEDIKSILLSQRDLYLYYNTQEYHHAIFGKEQDRSYVLHTMYPEPFGILTQRGKIPAPLFMQPFFENALENITKFYNKDKE